MEMERDLVQTMRLFMGVVFVLRLGHNGTLINPDKALEMQSQ
jgi:hypothetical protein